MAAAVDAPGVIMATVSAIYYIDDSGNVFPPDRILVTLRDGGADDDRYIQNEHPIQKQAGVYPVREPNVAIDARTMQTMRDTDAILFARCGDHGCKFTAPGGFSIPHPGVDTYDEGGWDQMAGIFVKNRAHFGTELYHMEHNASHGAATTTNSTRTIGVCVRP